MRSSRKHDASETLRLPDLISRCLNHEEAAFRQLVDEHQRYVFALAFRLLRNDEDAQDVVQETFVRVWKNLHEYDMRAKFTTWLYAITVNRAYDMLKSNARKRRRFSPYAFAEHEGAAGATEEESNLVNRDLAAKITELAGSLPPKQQQVFVLRDLQDLSVEEVAQVLSISVNSVKTNLCYARRFIREHMRPLEGMERRIP